MRPGRWTGAISPQTIALASLDIVSVESLLFEPASIIKLTLAVDQCKFITKFETPVLGGKHRATSALTPLP